MTRTTRARDAFLALALAWGTSGCEALGFRRPVDVEPAIERTTASGLRIFDLARGRLPAAELGDRVQVHYTASLADGEVFDSSESRGLPVTLELGTSPIVAGWTEGLVGLRTTGRRRLTIPPELAYGEEGLGDIVPPNATIVIEVELLEILAPEEDEEPDDEESTDESAPETTNGPDPAEGPTRP